MHALEDVPDKCLVHVHHVGKAFYETHFEVQADVFGEVSIGLGLLRAIRMPHLEHPFQSAPHHDLLVELRALRQVCMLLEVVDTEEGRPALRPGVNELGRDDLGEALRSQKLTEGSQRNGLNAEYVKHSWNAQTHGAMFKKRLQAILGSGFGMEYLQRRGLGA